MSDTSSSYLNSNQNSSPQHQYIPQHTYQMSSSTSTRFLACFRCRSKKAKCDDGQPVCSACARSNAECIRPSGRRRKRTRREMEEAEKEKARAEGREYYGRGPKYNMRLQHDPSTEASESKKSRTSNLDETQKFDRDNLTNGLHLLLGESSSQSAASSNHLYLDQPQYMRQLVLQPSISEPFTNPESQYPLASQTHLAQQFVTQPPILPQPQPISVPVLAPSLPYPHHSVINSAASHQSDMTGMATYSTHILSKNIGKHAFSSNHAGMDIHLNPSTNNSHAQSQGTSSPKHDDPGEVVESLSKQVAFLEGNPGESQHLKVHYSGCTAIHPGFNRIIIHLKLRQNSPKITSPDYNGKVPAPLTDQESAGAIEDPRNEMDDISDAAPPLDEQMLDVFFDNFGEHFPFLSRKRVEERVKADTMSVFLAYAMCALAVRFIPHSTRKPSHYIGTAWKLALPLLRLPSTDVVAGLLLLSWAEFGENSESGLWNFSGLAIRMALDLGLHKARYVETPARHNDDVFCGKLLFWCLFIMDRILAFGTGRRVTISAESVEIPLPTEDDMIPTSPALSLDQTMVLSPFVSIVKLFALAGQIANCMNNNYNAPKPLVSEDKGNSEDLHSLHNQLVVLIAGLPEQLTWSVENFRAQAARKQGGTYLFLHLWCNAILALIHHPNLGRDHPSGFATPHTAGLKRSIKLSLASSRQVADCLVFADLFDARSYCASPFVNQCLFIAGVAFVHDAKEEEILGGTDGIAMPDMGANGNPNVMGKGMQMQSAFINGLMKQNLSVVLKALKKMEGYWSGLGYIISVLEQRASGRGWAKIDFDITSDKSHRFISLPDMGLLKRLTGVRPINNGGSQIQNMDSITTQNIQNRSPECDRNWSFDSLLGAYQIQDVTASGVPTGFNFSSVFPGGLAWQQSS
uniref:Zn(2)-C6 fungal-type domain-containing protein n=1 Tax=Moniliophthora roreri TaxID=221103 RepID=A0A0W0FF04_MONRR